MKKLLQSLVLVSAMIATSAQAVPTLFFDGDLSYDAQTQQLSVTSVLLDTLDIVPQPDLNGTLNFSAQLTSSFAGFGLVIGDFGTINGQDDITVFDLNMVSLLTGNFNNLRMLGNAGNTGSSISGEFVATGGSLSSLFGAGNVIALQFNLDIALNDNTFDNNFTARIDGRLEGTSVTVSEPSTLALLGMSILLVGFSRRYGMKA